MRIRLLVLITLSFLAHTTRAQEPAPAFKIAIFAPLFLDSAFDDQSEYRYAKNVFPKFINPGLEFYEGAQLALDSLNKEKINLEVHVFDTRSDKESIQQQLSGPAARNASLLIAYCSSAEVKIFADAGLRNNIPVINVNLPNDGGVTGNPFFVMLNPTLKTQCEGIYRHIQKYYALNRLIVFRKKGMLEDRIRSYFEEYGKNTAGVPLKLTFVDLTDSFTLNQLTPYLDTTRQSLCVAGSLDENFGKRLASQLASLKKQNYKAAVMGMPTWDAIKDFTKPDYRDLEIIYSTPFYSPRTDKVSLSITNTFNTKMFARPSDMVMRGYETVWRFVKLLLLYKNDLASNLTRKEFNLFRDIDIQPVLNKQTMTLDYFENKKLYFLKWQDGLIKSVN
ncbi:MAG: amino acid ABC transporter substrate-binding protein [Sphingobacteriales bacterium]|nr:amino acid ABC transporter substrate-binding protein [Sphingobacteriales bacterium]